jgi:ADP-heptose:LPS heptosyltransferase
MLSAPRSILAIDSSPFGSSLGLLPALKAVREAHSATFLIAAATTGTCELIAADSLADATIDLGVIKTAGSGNAGGLKRFLALARRVRRYNFDLVLDFTPRVETMLLSRLLLRARTITPSPIPRAIEFVLTLAGSPRPERDRYTSVLEQLGLSLPKYLIAPRAEENSRFEQFLARGGTGGGELIVLLYSGGANRGGGWSIEAFAEVGTRLTNNFGVRVIAADQPADREFTAAIVRLLPAGSAMLAEPRAPLLVGALARASILITDDSAVALLTSTMGTPVVEISDSRACETLRSKRHRVVRAATRAKTSADEVYDIACEMIQESRSPALFDRA